MEIEKIEQRAFELMNLHGLMTNSWVFQFDNAKRRLGYCSHYQKIISLSKNIMPLLNDAELNDIILHEIAHALVDKKHGHDAVWRAKAIEIGCNGNRLYDGTPRIKHKYKGICPVCGHVITKHKRNVTSCISCGQKKFNRKYLFVWTLND
jgi:predicted SprT family Zn-dependent metalloprotease